MHRQTIGDRRKKTIGTRDVNTGKAIGNRHMETQGEAEKTEDRVRSGVGDALDAVREVVHSEK